MNPTLLLLAAASFFIVLAVTPRVASFMLKRGILGVDVHKATRPRIPEMCGVSLWIGVLPSILIASIADPTRQALYLAFALTGLMAGLVGLIDDLKPLHPVLKPVLTALSAAPILILKVYEPFPYLPFIGRSRLTIVYPILIPISLAVTSNAVNMMDVFNGVMPLTSIIAFITAFAALTLLGRGPESYLALCMAAALAAYYRYNRYPARVFSGDSGSLFVGACLGAVAILGRIEVVMVVALMPQILNAFYGLSSVGRLYERREVKARPVVVLPDGRLDVSKSRNAPLTLTRLILAEGPLSEKEVLKVMAALALLSSALAAVTYMLTPW
jgi:UDP-N-acetylglucosamine--dolichyl-phosphate N-acetylglucosaminephosphotransferase